MCQSHIQSGNYVWKNGRIVEESVKPLIISINKGNDNSSQEDREVNSILQLNENEEMEQCNEDGLFIVNSYTEEDRKMCGVENICEESDLNRVFMLSAKVENVAKAHTHIHTYTA